MGAAIALNYARQGDLVRPRVRATNLAIINGSQPQLPSFSSKVRKRVGVGLLLGSNQNSKFPHFQATRGWGGGQKSLIIDSRFCQSKC